MALSDRLTKLSDELTKLSARAQEAEGRAKAARDETRADLEQDIDSARASAQAQADKLRTAADESRDDISAWWTGVQRSWDERAAQVREHMESKKTEHDVRAAQRKADSAEADATFAIDFAYSAVVEAEYAVLDAALVRMEADEAAARAGATA
jgi:hypothetical protein